MFVLNGTLLNEHSNVEELAIDLNSVSTTIQSMDFLPNRPQNVELFANRLVSKAYSNQMMVFSTGFLKIPASPCNI